MSPCTATPQAPSPSFSGTDRSPRKGLSLVTLTKPKEMKEQKRIRAEFGEARKDSSLPHHCSPAWGCGHLPVCRGTVAPGSPAACTQTLLQAPSHAAASLLQLHHTSSHGGEPFLLPFQNIPHIYWRTRFIYYKTNWK